MPGRKNPLQMSQLLGQAHRAVDRAKDRARSQAQLAHGWAERHFEIETQYVDVTVHFIGASNIPKMDVIGSADPYFVAKIDNKIKFVSTVKPNTLAPVWNEYWRIKNVPTTANIHVEVLDKDDGTVTDDYIGDFTASVVSGTKEYVIEGPSLRRNRGTFWLKVDSVPATDTRPQKHEYTFDGPIRFSCHFSPTVGRLTNLNDARLYTTWKMFLRGVRLFFEDVVQPWNRNYKAAQTIFQGSTSIALRSTIQAGHRMLYARTTSNGFGVIDDTKDIITLLQGGSVHPASVPTSAFAHRVKPAVYTYIISADDDSFRFSETGAAFFVDFASKHALHANCAEAVRYSGEFHPRPEGGWENFRDDIPDDQVRWELVIDNNSGTYSPDPMMLPCLKELFEYNFPGFIIQAWDFNDPRLSYSRESCRAYALAHRGISHNDLQPHPHGEVALLHNVSAQVASGATPTA